MEKLARQFIERLMEVLEAPLEPDASPLVPGYTAKDYAEGAQLAEEVLLEMPINQLSSRLDKAAEVLLALQRNKRFTPWQVLTRGWKFWRSPWVTPDEEKAIASILLKYFSEDSDVVKVWNDYDREANCNLSSTVRVLATATVQLSHDLQQFLECLEKHRQEQAEA